MAQSGFTPISIYYSTTASAVPTAANLVPGELAINTNDGKLYYEDSSGVVQLLASKATSSGTFTTISVSGVATFSAGTVALPAITTTGDTNTGIFFPAADTIAFTEGGAEAMRIDSSGNVGIGTSSPTGSLEIATSSATSIVANSSNATGGWIEYKRSGTTYAYIGNAGALTGSNTDDLAIQAIAGKSLRFQTNGNNTRMRITDTGNVGIGTSSPDTTTLLTVAGAVTITGANSGHGASRLKLGQDTSAISQIRFYGADASTAGILQFTGSSSDGSVGSERMRIDSSGNLLVGTTSQFGSGKQCISFDGASFIGLSLQTTLASTGSSYIAFYNSAGNNAGTISQNGTTTVNYATSSDYRLKENIVLMTGALAKVAQLKPVTYKWKVDGSDGQGFIAHELQAIVPDCVTGEKDGLDKDGKPKYQGVDTSFLVATLVSAIQELKAEFDAYKATHP